MKDLPLHQNIRPFDALPKVLFKSSCPVGYVSNDLDAPSGGTPVFRNTLEHLAYILIVYKTG